MDVPDDELTNEQAQKIQTLAEILAQPRTLAELIDALPDPAAVT